MEKSANKVGDMEVPVGLFKSIKFYLIGTIEDQVNIVRASLKKNLPKCLFTKKSVAQTKTNGRKHWTLISKLLIIHAFLLPFFFPSSCTTLLHVKKCAYCYVDPFCESTGRLIFHVRTEINLLSLTHFSSFLLPGITN